MVSESNGQDNSEKKARGAATSKRKRPASESSRGKSQKSSDQNHGEKKAHGATGSKRPASESSSRGSRTAQFDVIKTLAGTSSRVVEQAASVLEEEVAAGIVAAKRVEEQVVNVSKLRSGRPDEVMKRFRRDAHEVVDILIDMVNIATRSLGSLAEDSVTMRQPESEQDNLAAPSGFPVLSVPGAVRPGHSVEVPLALENDGETPTDKLHLHCTDLIDASGDQIAASHITFTPASLVIGPHSSEKVVVMVAVPADTPPGTYSGLVQATNLRQLRAVISVEVA